MQLCAAPCHPPVLWHFSERSISRTGVWRMCFLLGKPRPRGEVRCLGRKATGKASGDSAGFPCFCFLSSDLRSGISLRTSDCLSGPASVLFGVWLPRLSWGLGVLRDLILHLARITGWLRLEGTSGVQLVQLPSQASMQRTETCGYGKAGDNQNLL